MKFLFRPLKLFFLFQGYRTGYLYRMPDVFISGSPSKKIPESRVPPQVSSDRIPYQVYYEQQQQQAAAPGMFGAPSMGRGNTHRNRLKWLNNPVQGTRYAKQEKEYQRPQLEVCLLFFLDLKFSRKISKRRFFSLQKKNFNFRNVIP